MLENMIMLGYVLGAIGLVGCIASYFIFPRILELIVNSKKEGE